MKTFNILAVFSLFSVAVSAGEPFRSHWPEQTTRPWAGPGYWTNPMEDWRIADGRLECRRGGGNRNVHLLTHQLNEKNVRFQTSVLTGYLEGGNAKGSTGFRLGIMDELGDYRSSLFRGGGINIGLSSEGDLFIDQKRGKLSTIKGVLEKGVELVLSGEPAGEKMKLSLTAYEPEGEVLGSVSSTLDPARLKGNIALVNNHQASGRRRRGKAPEAGQGTAFGTQAKFWFRDWELNGAKADVHPDQAFGPILFASHTLSRNVMKMTVQMPPVAETDAQTVRLEADGKTTEAPIHPLARTATFRIESWPSQKDVPYRILYTLDGKEHDFTGTVRREPGDRDVVVAGFTGNTDPAFPNAKLAGNVMIQDPDVLVFTGDQLYESVGGYGIHRGPVDLATLNYLRKWYMCGWAFRDLMRDRISIFLPDDHDVYQGNIWGNGGNPITMANHQAGGFAMPAEWVNMVMRTQTSHHPDLFDPTPMKQDIDVFYGDMLYGRVSFAIIADRYFKSGPKGNVPPTGGRPDHVRDPDFDPQSVDVPGVVLLGDRQL
ncbi:MAG: hypothetical protein AAF492_16525, partial [Verrucomicrobiota bacterium]